VFLVRSYSLPRYISYALHLLLVSKSLFTALPAPIVPAIKSQEDLSNFDDYGLDPKAHFPPYKPAANEKIDWDAEF
jgi:hypothetical protein